ncbi:unnamed protein product [Diamesa serratosioi]
MKIVFFIFVFCFVFQTNAGKVSSEDDVRCGGANEEYTSCGSACGDLTCDNPTGINIICTDNCKTGCYCKKGYVRNKTGQCVLISKCPRRCPINEEFSCGNPMCEETCTTIGKPCTIFILRCEDKCYCRAGYVRLAKDKVCVPARNCPRT